ncbi:ribosome assembly RNA-binding protein YhbY [Gilvimarinus agarilyticus]|uniref:ribosome assembly RNA-binding protein YhbY n=1 Tax=Gilvimarinus agarilyticus TaxID=679259 RepID=UPI0005A2F2E9|nr:ribosome assembly RNA-binding protein YhbY [Gilvimarinus agarilyticus]|tara:strand:- start:1724 stop:2026 length:303 start_codon:yes stop_codon:yes gene_type:complete
MSSNSERKKQFRSLGHNLKPIVTIADNGLSEGVLSELNRALDDHELIKVKLALTEREDRQQITEEIRNLPKTEVIQQIGKVLLLYRGAKKPNPKLSNLLR